MNECITVVNIMSFSLLFFPHLHVNLEFIDPFNFTH